MSSWFVFIELNFSMLNFVRPYVAVGVIKKKHPVVLTNLTGKTHPQINSNAYEYGQLGSSNQRFIKEAFILKLNF